MSGNRALAQFWVDLFDGLGCDFRCDLKLLDWTKNTPCSPDCMEDNGQWCQYQKHRPQQWMFFVGPQTKQHINKQDDQQCSRIRSRSGAERAGDEKREECYQRDERRKAPRDEAELEEHLIM